MGKKPVWQAYNTLITLRTTRYIWHISYICCDLFLHYVNNSFKGVLQACLMFIPKLIKRDLVRIQGCFFTPQEKTSIIKANITMTQEPFSLSAKQIKFKQNATFLYTKFGWIVSMFILSFCNVILISKYFKLCTK